MEPTRTLADKIRSLSVSQEFTAGDYHMLMVLDAGGLWLSNLHEGGESLTVPWPALQAFSTCFRETILAYARHKEQANEIR